MFQFLERSFYDRRSRFSFAAIVLFACAAGAMPHRVRAEATAEQIEDTVRRGVKFLKTAQQPDGSWEISADIGAEAGSLAGKQWGGLTALATYTLLASGENPSDPHVKKSIDWLLDKGGPMVGTYAIAMKAQVWSLLPTDHKRHREVMASARHDFDLLMKGCQGLQGALGQNPVMGIDDGFYGYFAGSVNHHDRSASAYAASGVDALDRAGIEVPLRYWDFIYRAWKGAQGGDGSWNYTQSAPARPNITAGGLATLYLALIRLGDPVGRCSGNVFNQNIDKGCEFIDKSADSFFTGDAFEALYDLENFALLSGRAHIGKRDWFEDGANFVVRSQNGDGGYGVDDGANNAKFIPNTCFATLFLARGGAPILVSKLQWRNAAPKGKDSGWNQRQQDCANVTDWIGKEWGGKRVSWRIVDLSISDALPSSRLIYMAGSEAFDLDAKTLDALQKYIEDGGTILGNADCAKAAFVKSFREIGIRLFPGHDFKELEATHPIFTAEIFKASKWKKRPKVLGLTDGDRDVIFLIPEADAGKAWNGRNDMTHRELFELGANIISYSTGGRLAVEHGVEPEAIKPAKKR